MRARGAAVALPALVGGLWMQIQRAAHAPLPEYDDLDPSGFYGAGELGDADRPVRMALVGDSTLTGPGLDRAGDVFAVRVADRSPYRVQVIRHAVGGSRVADVLMHQLPAVLDDPPEVAVLSIGANDAVHNTPLGPFERDIRAVVGALDRAGVPTVVCGLIDLSLIPRIPPALRSLLALRGAAYERRKRRATHPAARAVYVPVGRTVNEAFRARGEAFFVPDRFHPSTEGHRCLAERLDVALTPLLARVGSTRAVVGV
jgi:lysophospholipase L1-like esterase